ncbi:aldehyde dehydrogenase family protein [bacterium]|nr:aldehyde dehydrogenase family protein [bacterium]
MDYPLIAGGKEIYSDEKFEIHSPYDGSIVGRVSAATEEIVEEAISRAEFSFDETSHLCARHREDILLRAKNLLTQRAEDFARTISLEMGKTIREARGEVSRAQETLALAAALTREPIGEVLPYDIAPNGAKKWGFYQRFPAGPVLAITPFNFPLNLAMHKIAPAISVGNPFILKPASATPITGLMLGKLILDAGYPADAVSVLPGSGAKIAEPIAADDRIKVVTFTGSAEVGKKLAAKVGMKHIAMELGSNSAAIVLADADLLRAADRIVLGAMALAGQVCISVQRVYVEETIFDTLVEHIVSASTKLRLGDPLQENTDVGPVISEKDAVRIEGLIADAVSKGGNVLCGGKRNGTLFEPTVLTNVPQNADVIQKEAFAPLVVVNPVVDINEAIAMVNDSRYGLQAGIFTADIRAARKAFQEINVGGVIVNDVPTFRADVMPYGGIKDSGMGREGPKFAVEHMTYLKAFVVHYEEE